MFVWIGQENFVDIKDIRRVRKYDSSNRFILQAAVSSGFWDGNEKISFIESAYTDRFSRDSAFFRLVELVQNHQEQHD